MQCYSENRFSVFTIFFTIIIFIICHFGSVFHCGPENVVNTTFQSLTMNISDQHKLHNLPYIPC